MFNSGMFSARNVVVIGAFTVLVHVLARPLYNLVDKKGTPDNG